jgi:endonuclease/exonuclease/phosphatase family metal-dependent hydrolase
MILRILTYNTHLFGTSNAAYYGLGHRPTGAWSGADTGGEPVVYGDAARAKDICERIKNLSPQPDIVALQEVWDFSLHSVFFNELKKAGYEFYVPQEVNPVILSPLSAIGHIFGPVPVIGPVSIVGLEGLKLWLKKSRHRVGSGLMLISKFKIKEGKIFQFPAGTFPPIHKLGDIKADHMATKGVLTCTLETKPGDTAGDIRIGVAHAGTECGGFDLRHIDWIIEHTLRTEPAVMLGDFNVNWVRTSREEWPDKGEGVPPYEKMSRIFRDKADAQDVYPAMHPSIRWQDYRDKLAGFLFKYWKTIETLPVLRDPVVIHFKKPDHTERNQIFCRRWVCPDRQDESETDDVLCMRKELADLTAGYGITTNDPANLIYAYFANISSIRYLVEKCPEAMKKAESRAVPGFVPWLAHGPTRLDYVYVKPDGAKARLDPTGAEVLRDWADERLWDQPDNNEVNSDGGKTRALYRPTMGRVEAPHLVDLSDHYPLLAALEVTLKA